jgi:hypothetical protein
MTAHRHRRHPTELKIRLAESYLNGEGSLKGIAKAHDLSHNDLTPYFSTSNNLNFVGSGFPARTRFA